MTLEKEATHWDVTLRVVDVKAARLKKEAGVRCSVGAKKEVFRTAAAVTSISLADAVATPRAVWTADTEPGHTAYDYCTGRDGPLRLTVLTGGDVTVGSCDLPVFAAATATPVTLVLPLAGAGGGHVSVEVVAVAATRITRCVPLRVKGYRRCICACDGPLLLFFREKHAPPAACAELVLNLAVSRVLVGGVRGKKPPLLTVVAAGDDDGGATEYELRPDTLADAAFWTEQLLSRAAAFTGAPLPEPVAVTPSKKSASVSSSSQHCRLFGMSLDEIAAATEAHPQTNTVPVLFETLFTFVESHLDEGIYRLGCSPSEVELLLAKIDALRFDSAPLELCNISVHTVGGACKLLLRRLDMPLLPNEAAAETSLSTEEIMRKLREMITGTQGRSRSLLARLVKHLQTIVAAADITKMKSVAVAVVFGPILMPSVSPMLGNSLAEALISHGEELFTTTTTKEVVAMTPTTEASTISESETPLTPSIATAAAATTTPQRHHHRRHSKRPSSAHEGHKSPASLPMPVDRTAAVTHVLAKSSDDQKRIAKRLFRIFDGNHCGKLTNEEFVSMLGDLSRASPQPQRLSGVLDPASIAQHLADSTGRVSFRAFKGWWMLPVTDAGNTQSAPSETNTVTVSP